MPEPDALPRLELVSLGPPTARLEGHEPPPEVLWPKHLGLLIYLALSPSRARTRDHLLGLFWADKPEAKARHALNEAVRRLRRCLGDARLRSEGEALALAGEKLDVDAARLTAAAAHEPADAAALVRGDFLEGFVVEAAPAFEDWAARERQRYRGLAAAALVASGEAHVAACRFADAQDAARRALALEPLSEPAARLLMRAAALSGDSGVALAALHEFSERLERELGEQPSRALAALGDRIRSQTWRPRAVASDEPPPPLVGRAEAYREAFDEVAAGLADGPRALLIIGALGMGSTRLVAECVERLALEGGVVAVARPLASDLDVPWSALRLLLRAGLLEAPGVAAASPDALAVLAGLVPELAERHAPRAARDVADVAGALVSVLGAVGEERPVGLAIDDAHFSDGATLAALRGALERLRGRAVVFILSGPERDEHAPREWLELQGSIGRGLRGTTVRLGPLTPDDVRRLVDALAPWCKTDDERDRLARRLHFEAGGNPFFTVTLLGGLQRIAHLRSDFTVWPRPQATFETPLPFTLPNLARAAIAARVAELDDDSRRILAAASIAGLSLDLDLIAALTELPRARIEDRLGAAERRQLIAFDGQRYAFASPLVAEAVRAECLTAGQQQSLRRRGIAALAGRDDLEARVLRAEFLSHTDPGPGAFQEAATVARAALAAGSTRTARRALGAAEHATRRRSAEFGPALQELRAEVGGSPGGGKGGGPGGSA